LKDVISDIKARLRSRVDDALNGMANLDTYGLEGAPGEMGTEALGVCFLPAPLIPIVRAALNQALGHPEVTVDEVNNPERN
jgi:hypothetical protein